MSEQNEGAVQSVAHTPGPWKIMSDEARGKPRCLIVDQQGGEIASVNPYRQSWESDAEAIAAAPVMLDALRRIVRHQDGIGGSMAFISPARHIAAQAIQHATGEQL